MSIEFNAGLQSHLLQMRGLKHVNMSVALILSRSHLLQMRGLKHFPIRLMRMSQLVASFTDAWIETSTLIPSPSSYLSHLLQMRGLKHTQLHKPGKDKRSHLLQMRGLKHHVS